MGDDIPRYDSLEEEDAARRARAKKRGLTDLQQVAIVIGAIAIGLFVLVKLGGSGGSEESSADEDSSLACDHFRNVAAEADLLTDEELREKLQEVYDNASIGTFEVRLAARRMLAATTAGDLDSLETAVVAMDEACSDAGH